MQPVLSCLSPCVLASTSWGLPTDRCRHAAPATSCSQHAHTGGRGLGRATQGVEERGDTYALSVPNQTLLQWKKGECEQDGLVCGLGQLWYCTTELGVRSLGAPGNCRYDQSVHTSTVVVNLGPGDPQRATSTTHQIYRLFNPPHNRPRIRPWPAVNRQHT